MKPIKREFLNDIKILRFKKSNNFSKIFYFDKTLDFNDGIIYYNYFGNAPDKIKVEYIYLDTSKKTDTSECLEYTIKTEYSLKGRKDHKSEYAVNIDFKIGSNELWKIIISAIDKKETELSVTLS